MHTYVLEREQIIERSKAETFSFFGDAFNLERITPGFLKFRIVTPRPIRMEAGRIIDYKLALYGIGFSWRTMIESWEPSERFVDTQLCGPYNLWHHTHTFEEIGPNRTRMKDVVLYRIPFGPLGRLAHWLFVRRALTEIFNYRAAMTEKLLSGNVEPAPTPRPARALSLVGDGS
ncbi:MAG: SRPBCC family protein [Blastocatellia bacterium]|nr:SRPBCC family protein [Blastocatellia bacterium]